MSSRRRRGQAQGGSNDPFQPAAGAGDLEDFANVLYGGSKLEDELRRAEGRSSRIKSISVEIVRPDAAQARRVMPTALRAAWLKQPQQIADLLAEWSRLADEEALSKGRPALNILDTITHNPDDVAPIIEDSEFEDAGPIESSFQAVLQLAASIHLHGLANPITVVSQSDGTYLLESGERRLLAYNLLHSLQSDLIKGNWDAVPARVVEERSLWRQAAENGARLDLNAISMARQLALLLMDIYADKYSFARYTEMPSVEWYAQILDSKKYPVPYGRGAELAAAMGLKSAAQIRQYRQLLGLPAEVWQIADELNWTEYKIRELLRRARSVTTVTDSDEDDFSHESVTTVTDRLVDLAKYEAGLLVELPDDLADELDIEKESRPRKKEAGEKRGSRGVTGYVLNVDATTGTVTVQIDDEETLQALLDGKAVKVSLKPEA